MSRAAKLVWVIGTLSTLSFIVLVLISKTQVEPEGFMTFDSHLFGYTPEYAVEFLKVMNAEQSAAYLGPFRTVDTIFPPLLTLTLLGVIWLNAQGEPRYMRFAALLGPILYLAFDFMENDLVGQIVASWPQFEAADVTQAAIFTQAKWMCLALSFLVAIWAWRFAAKEPAS